MECVWLRCCNKFTAGISMVLKAFIREGICMGGHLYGRALIWEGTYMGEFTARSVYTRSSKVRLRMDALEMVLIRKVW